jgi:hypothetical protein
MTWDVGFAIDLRGSMLGGDEYQVSTSLLYHAPLIKLSSLRADSPHLQFLLAL